MWQAIATIAVPVLSIILGLFSSGGATRLSKKISHHAGLLKQLRDADADAAADNMSSLLDEEVQTLRAREGIRHGRILNKTNLFLALVLGIGTGVSVYFLWGWVTATLGSTLAFFSISSLVIVSLAGLLLTAAGFSTLYQPAKTAAERKAEKERKAEAQSS